MTRLKRRKEVENASEATTPDDVRFGTPELVAQHRAKRLRADTIVEIGAGAGFQTGAFAAIAKRVIAVDIDPERLSRAHFPQNVIPIAGDALDPATIRIIKERLDGKVAVFLDPERPASSTHRTLSEVRPFIPKFLDMYAAISEDIAIELPPFLDAKEIPGKCEREYLSVDGQLNRLTAYFGGLRACDVSVVRLPGEERIEHNGRRPGLVENLDEARFVLEPDAALAHAGLVPLALPAHYRRIPGKKPAFLASKRPASGWFRAYRIVAAGDDATIRRALARRPPAAIILHGSVSQDDQRRILASYRPLCHGDGRLHLFIGRQRYLTTRE